MKLHLHLLEFLTPEDILEEALANNHRYSADPVFAKTGVGFLKSATEAEKAAEMVRSGAFMKRLEERKAAAEPTRPAQG
jgi:hypothetical protein